MGLHKPQAAASLSSRRSPHSPLSPTRFVQGSYLMEVALPIARDDNKQGAPWTRKMGEKKGRKSKDGEGQ
ncbi:hypothetical protein E2C01_056229 [Portunus trituberculatus]|uniref:Uncharacterized protein n=1 Tax=Portunus trituberculatus TaxID=210409 RepID=A0A5B7GX05_PORTR|nr:hypothetical protein [Portunus trituberculatus]